MAAGRSATVTHRVATAGKRATGLHFRCIRADGFYVGGHHLLVAATDDFELPSSELRTTDKLVAIGGLAFASIFSLPFTAALFVMIADWRHRSPRIEITADGFLDRRATATVIAWSEIERLQMHDYGGPIPAVRLLLKHPINAKQNPFRLGAWHASRLGKGSIWRRASDELKVPVKGLSESGGTLALAMAELVTAHGGQVEILALKLLSRR